MMENSNERRMSFDFFFLQLIGHFGHTSWHARCQFQSQIICANYRTATIDTIISLTIAAFFYISAVFVCMLFVLLLALRQTKNPAFSMQTKSHIHKNVCDIKHL